MKKNSDAMDKKRTDLSFSPTVAKIVLAQIAVILMLCIAVSVTYAQLISTTQPVQNTFEPGKIVIGVNETFDGTTKSDVKIKNDQRQGSNIDSFIRVALVFNWVDDDGNIVAVGTPAAGTDYTISYGTDWFQGSDGYWYHVGSIAPGETTSALITSCTVNSSSANGALYHLSIDILAQGIQIVPESTVHECWPAVQVSNGKLAAS